MKERRGRAALRSRDSFSRFFFCRGAQGVFCRASEHDPEGEKASEKITNVRRSGSNVWAAFWGSDWRGLPEARCRISAGRAEIAAALSEVLGLMSDTRRMAETLEKGGSGPWSLTEARKQAGGALAASKVGGQLGEGGRIFLKGADGEGRLNWRREEGILASGNGTEELKTSSSARRN